MNESFPIPRSLIYVPRESPTVRCGAILRRALHILVLAAVIVFSGAARTARGEETAVIAGTVLHAGKPVSGATIWLFADSGDSDSAGTAEPVGASGGTFTLEGLKEGDSVVIEVEKPGFDLAGKKEFTVIPGMAEVVIRLEKKPTANISR